MANFATVDVMVSATETRQINLNELCEGYEYLNGNKLRVISNGVSATSCSMVVEYGDLPIQLYFDVMYDDTDSGEIDFSHARDDEGNVLDRDDVEKILNDLPVPEDDEEDAEDDSYFSFDNMEEVVKSIGVFCICGGN